MKKLSLLVDSLMGARSGLIKAEEKAANMQCTKSMIVYPKVVQRKLENYTTKSFKMRHIEQKLSKIQILVVEGSAKASKLVTKIFSELGFSNCVVASDALEAMHVMQTVRINVLYIDADIRANLGNNDSPVGVKAVNFVKSLRYSKASPNPFLPIVIMVDKTTDREFKDIRDSGINEILLRPIDAEIFCKRLISIVQKPRLFITASTYKGPCRRLENKALRYQEDRRKAQIVLVRNKGRK